MLYFCIVISAKEELKSIYVYNSSEKEIPVKYLFYFYFFFHSIEHHYHHLSMSISLNEVKLWKILKLPYTFNKTMKLKKNTFITD